MTPFAEKVGNYHRVYFAGRDKTNRAQIGYFDVDMADPTRIIRVGRVPLVGLGSLGSFDDSGCNSPCIVDYDGLKYLYYTGWSLGVTVPFYTYVGLAISKDRGETFQKVSKAPILERNEIDPYMTHSSYVIIEDEIWKMWYSSCTHWKMENSRPKHYYHIKYATSFDGIHWVRDGTVCIDYQYPDEYAIARPCVFKEGHIYKMWYCYRGVNYKIGYAESKDGFRWQRKDRAVGIDVSDSGWDSEMICYPHVFEHRGKKYMLYNGNGYGKTGVGLAMLDQEE